MQHPSFELNFDPMPLRGNVRLLLMLLLLDFTTEICMMPAPSRAFMDSANMGHILSWAPLGASCNSTVLYSVQYQGEFELHIKNGSWVKASKCQRIRVPYCDLTSDLGSDADYNLRVRAQCGSQGSAWTRISFNRNNITPPVPEISAMTSGDVLQVAIKRLPVTAVVHAMVWKKGAEKQAKVYLIPAEQDLLHTAALQEGAVYCVKAQVVLSSQIHSGYSDTRCVSATDASAPAWKTPTTVTLTLVVLLGLLVGLFWFIVHCRLDQCQKYFHKEPLPQSLRGKWDVQILVNPQKELQEEEPTSLLTVGTDQT